jgi:hypothetical protein
LSDLQKNQIKIFYNLQNIKKKKIKRGKGAQSARALLHISLYKQDKLDDAPRVAAGIC